MRRDEILSTELDHRDADNRCMSGGVARLRLPGWNPGTPTQVVACDLGARSTKSVWVQRRGSSYALLGYAVHDAPAPDRAGSTERLSEHLKAITSELGGRVKHAVLVVGVGDSLLRHAELPLIPLADMRQMLRFNPKAYLQQDLSDYVFDCCIVPPRSGNGSEPAKVGQKGKVLVGGARRQAVLDLQAAAKAAGLVPTQVVPGWIGPANAFEATQPELFARGAVVLVDIGFKHTTISLLLAGELALNRVVPIGGQRFNTALSDALRVSSADAETLQVESTADTQAALAPVLAELAREIRASVDFFETQHEHTVGQVLVSGGAARSAQVVQALKEDLVMEVRAWNPVATMTLALPPRALAELEPVAPQLAVAVGAALSAL